VDYSKLTKQELLDILTNQEVQKDKSGYFERQVEDLQKLVEEKERALEDQIKARDSAISEMMRLQDTIIEKEYVIKTNAEQKITQEKSYKFLEEKFNELAKLFEEYMTAFKDQIKLSEVMYKNSNYVLQALEIKIKKFNGSDSE
jgi:rRNA maturation protein Rpf1